MDVHEDPHGHQDSRVHEDPLVHKDARVHEDPHVHKDRECTRIQVCTRAVNAQELMCA